MNYHFHPRTLMTCITLCATFTHCALAVKDEENQGRWETPAKAGPDTEVPGFLINMGPTGARGILMEQSYIIKYVFKKSPADGILELNDEVYGANGKKFGSHVFGGTNINRGIEGPLQDLGLAIEDSEGEDGVLEQDCPKTKILQERALKYLVDNSGGIDSQGRCVATLALIASDNQKFSRAGKQLALNWNEPYNDGTWAWHLGFQGIALAEYHLLTGDRKVLSTLEKTLELLEGAQWKSPINHVNREKMKNPSSKEEVDKAQNLYAGGFGHAPYSVIVKRGGGGYGPMQWPTCLALMTWQLSKECGLEFAPESPDRSFSFLDHGTTNAGKVAYGGEFTLNNGVVDHVKWKKSMAHKFSHKSGLAYIVHMLSSERKESKKSMKLHLGNIDTAYKDMADGHACGLMGFTWGLAGVYASDDKKLKKKITNYYKAYFNLARCHGSNSYVVLPNRDYADGSYYRKNIRNHTTAAMAFIYSFSSPKLRVHGVDGTEKTSKATEKPSLPNNPYRTFTNAEGNGSFIGSLLIFDHRGGIVRIRKRNGSTVDVDFADLSEKDQEYLREYYYANRK